LDRDASPDLPRCGKRALNDIALFNLGVKVLTPSGQQAKWACENQRRREPKKRLGSVLNDWVNPGYRSVRSGQTPFE